MLATKTSYRPEPLWFRAARSLPFGRYRALNYMRKIGLLDHVVNVPFHGRSVHVPLEEITSGENLDNYQYRRIRTFASVCDTLLGKYDFIDCGAHLGLFAAQFLHFSTGTRHITAIEPNKQLFPLIESNLQIGGTVEVECLQAALADFEGRGRLVSPEHNSNSDAMYLVSDPSGDINVVTLSSLLNSRNRDRLAIKIDVEGYEAAILSEAAPQLRALSGIAMFIELHEEVLRRIGMSDIAMLKQIESIRKFSWINSVDGAEVDSSRSVFPQVGLERQCDLIGLSI